MKVEYYLLSPGYISFCKVISHESTSVLLCYALLSRFSCVHSVRPHRRQPTRLLRPWDSPGKNIGVDCHFLLQCMKVKSLNHVQLCATPQRAAHQAPSSLGFSRQEHWSGLPFPSPTSVLRVCISLSK